VPSKRVNDIEMAYRLEGAGDPLLMIMGITGSKYHWLGFEKKLAADFLTIAFDNRGVGETSAPPGPYAMTQMAADTVGLLDALAIDRVHVFGVSMGGMVAQEIALTYPERVRTLVLGCTHFGGTQQVLASPEVYQRAFVLAGKGPEQSMRDILSVNLTADYMRGHPDVVEHLVAYGLEHRMTREAFAGQMAAVADHDTADRLGNLRASRQPARPHAGHRGGQGRADPAPELRRDRREDPAGADHPAAGNRTHVLGRGARRVSLPDPAVHPEPLKKGTDTFFEPHRKNEEGDGSLFLEREASPLFLLFPLRRCRCRVGGSRRSSS
jgi:pimeloyl-ACP methyl ester carboxylesterase